MTLAQLMPETKTLSSSDLSALAAYKKSCDLEKLNHEDTKKALQECQINPPAPNFYQEPVFIVGVGVGAFLLGLLSGLAVK